MNGSRNYYEYGSKRVRRSGGANELSLQLATIVQRPATPIANNDFATGMIPSSSTNASIDSTPHLSVTPSETRGTLETSAQDVSADIYSYVVPTSESLSDALLSGEISQKAREYQLDLLREAKDHNVIAVLDTGSGKTLISIMLIKHMAGLEVNRLKESPAASRRISFFLVPAVPLVFQQKDYIRRSCDLRVKHYYGDMGVAAWTERKWISELADADVCVMTPDIARDILQRAFITMDMAPFYDIPPAYIIAQKLGGENVELLKKPLKQMFEACDELGPWCATMMFLQELEEAALTVKRKVVVARQSAQSGDVMKREYLETLLQIIKNIYRAIKTVFHPTPTEDQISPKVVTLINIIKEQALASGNEFCGMVFTQRRGWASVLSTLLQKWKDLDSVKAGFLVGHGTSQTNDAVTRMKVKQQQETVRQFRTGELNLLVATKVAEEGLDIRSCRLVVRFDMFETLAGYIQSRGRARHQLSLFVVMAEARNPGHRKMIESMQKEEQNMREAIIARQNAIAEELDDASEDDGTEPDEMYIVENTGASISKSSAIGRIHNYCSLLPSDKYCDNRPNFIILTEEGGYAVELKMPVGVPTDCQSLKSAVKGSKTAAKRTAAFEMVKMLHRAGELDDRLSPLRPVKEKQEAPALEKIRRQIRDYDVHIPFALRTRWADVDGGWLMIVNQVDAQGSERLMDLGFLSSGRPEIQNARLVFKEHETSTRTISACVRIPLTAEEIKKIKRFHYRLFSGILRTDLPSDAEWNPLVVPLCCAPGGLPEGGIDWTIIDCCQKEEDESLLGWAGSFDDLIVHDRIYHGRNYAVNSVLEGVNPFTEDFGGNFKTRKTVAEFYTGSLGCKERISPEQEVLVGTPLPYITQHIDEPPRPTKEAYLIPQFCTVYPIPARIMTRDALIIPLLMRRLLHLLATRDLKVGRGLQLRGRDGLMLEEEAFPASIELLECALTAKEAAEFWNYERLETLGDSFLKVQQTVHFFVHHPDKREDGLTNLRSQAERNSTLHGHATQTGVANFILKDPLSRSSYAPPSLNEAKIKISMSDKTVADLAEAIIGANVVDAGVPGGAQAVQLLLDSQYEVDWKRYDTIWKQNRRVGMTVETAESLLLEKVQERLGYKFADVAYLVEALTHASAEHGNAQNYQRLEFLGDAVLNFLTMRYLFGLPQKLQPSSLSDIRSELVCNQFLACVSWYYIYLQKFLFVTRCSDCRYLDRALALPKNLQYISSALAADLRNFGTELEEMVMQSGDEGLMQMMGLRNDEVEAMDDVSQISSDLDDIHMDHAESTDATLNLRPDLVGTSTKSSKLEPLFWNDLQEAPKTLGDLYESVLGAVLVDSGFDIQQAWMVMDKTLMKPWLNRFKMALETYDGVTKFNAEAELHRLEGKLRCRHFNRLTDEPCIDADVTCTIQVHGTVVGMGKGKSKSAARRAAAANVVEKVRGQPDWLSSHCKCD
ncbi:hypothetical protein HK097_003535 [Rhizophlyctis rosea]|uniref:Dicer-like protein 1 n=1 Tax=Rhizophlyctis rosea TaxID=64517 RepID=A0AAD5SFV6_9FUNG|nr:hypothetical protein HK097_003535 [Rhizophlyctis rosea]